MKKLEKIVLTAIAAATMISGGMLSSAKTQAATKHITIWRINGSTLAYHKAYNSVEYMDADWENIIGGGKLHKVKISPKAAYYAFDANKMKSYRTTKKIFKKKAVPGKKYVYNNKKVYYGGIACKITLKKNIVTKLVQEYQP